MDVHKIFVPQLAILAVILLWSGETELGVGLVFGHGMPTGVDILILVLMLADVRAAAVETWGVVQTSSTGDTVTIGNI